MSEYCEGPEVRISRIGLFLFLSLTMQVSPAEAMTKDTAVATARTYLAALASGQFAKAAAMQTVAQSRIAPKAMLSRTFAKIGRLKSVRISSVTRYDQPTGAAYAIDFTAVAAADGGAVCGYVVVVDDGADAINRIEIGHLPAAILHGADTSTLKRVKAKLGCR